MPKTDFLTFNKINRTFAKLIEKRKNTNYKYKLIKENESLQLLYKSRGKQREFHFL